MNARPLAAGLALALLVLASLGTGAARIDLAAGGGWTTLVLMESRLPRTLAVLLTGAALAVAGTVIQSLVRNRFVGPDTAGTGESAALGLLGITLLAPAAPIWIKMVAASLAAGIGMRQPSPPDEPRFVLAARTMVETGRWLLPQRGIELYAEKPPVFM